MVEMLAVAARAAAALVGVAAEWAGGATAVQVARAEAVPMEATRAAV